MKIENHIKKIASSEFFKYSAALLSSNAVAQVIGFIIYPVITRIYSKETFGEFNLFFSIAGILTLFATGRYNLAIILPESEKKALALFQLSMLLTLGFSLLLCIPAFWGKNLFADLFNRKELSTLLPLLPLFVLISGSWNVMNYYFTRQKKYYNISIYNISQSVVNAISKCLLGLKGFVHFGLIWGTFFGQFSALVIAFFKSDFPLHKVLRINKAEIKEVAKTYSNFPKYELPNESLIAIAGNLPVLLLSVYFDMAEIGLYALALAVASNPVYIFANSMYQVLFERFSGKVRTGEKIKRELVRFCKVCFIAILPFFILFMFISEWVFGLLFGAEWCRAGLYFKYMLPWQFMVILTLSLCCIPDVFFKQKAAMKIELIHITVRIISLSAGIYFNNFQLAIALYCTVSVIISGIKLVWYFNLVKQYDNNKTD
ncbi:MAG: lipopolysaccharide biosynthesis protein [Dysgonamonadaceae bacterium]|jgi:O-antigen/teichoic acid export membrane protein|nr:lipopolysaccharide biosynthesis protein [Dysgonamonadaceae bacterium]